MLDQVRVSVADCGLEGVWLEPGFRDEQELAGTKGAYLLLLRLSKEVTITLPGRPETSLCAGNYVYCGSARGSGGIAARLKRHFCAEKKLHWHVDRLTLQSEEMAALAIPAGDECDLAAHLLRSKRFEVAVEGFGSSDCRLCRSHLLMPD